MSFLESYTQAAEAPRSVKTWRDHRVSCTLGPLARPPTVHDRPSTQLTSDRFALTSGTGSTILAVSCAKISATGKL